MTNTSPFAARIIYFATEWRENFAHGVSRGKSMVYFCISLGEAIEESNPRGTSHHIQFHIPSKI
jgi:hypothetical protein